MFVIILHFLILTMLKMAYGGTSFVDLFILCLTLLY